MKKISKYHLLTEDKEGKNMSKARRVAKEYWPEGDAQQIITDIRNSIPNSRINDCAYLPGVTRMYMTHQLGDGETIMSINRVLELVGRLHANDYNHDLNGLSAQELIQRFSGVAQADIENKIKANGQRNFEKNNDYQIIRIPSFEKAREFGDYTDWCVTQSSSAYNNYTNGGIGIFYFILKNGFENIRREKGINCPLDEYGLSMIAVSVNSDKSLNTITCRWNHDNGGNDNIMDDEKLSSIIGQDVYQVLTPRPVKILAKNGDWEIIDKGYGEVVACNNKIHQYAKFDEDGFATIKGDYNSDGMGKINMEGKVVIEPEYWGLTPVDCDGCAIGLKYSYCLINTRTGEKIFNSGPSGDVVFISRADKNGTRIYKTAVYEYGLINVLTGLRLNSKDYMYIGECDKDGNRIFTTQDKKIGLFDDFGHIVCDAGVYSDIDDCGEDNCRMVEKGNLHGLLDPHGQELFLIEGYPSSSVRGCRTVRITVKQGTEKNQIMYHFYYNNGDPYFITPNREKITIEEFNNLRL